MNGEDRDLGMDRKISRRDLFNGLAVSAGVTAMSKTLGAPRLPEYETPASESDYPPLRQGYRGQYPGSYDAAHDARDGKTAPEGEATGEVYDLVVVGAGLSGLAAAWYYRERAGAGARILLLENLDDFGGHAKRNEFVYKGRTFLASGGSDWFINPTTWPYDVVRMVRSLGVDLNHDLGTYHPEIFDSRGLGLATFFNKEAYGKDELVVGGTPQRPTAEFLAKTPIARFVQEDLLRLMTDPQIDYLKGLSKEEKISKLRSMSYREYLLKVVQVHPEVLPYNKGVWCLSDDTATAWFAYFRAMPGFAGLGVERPYGSPEAPEYEARNIHLPSGNHSFARLVVRSLIPNSLAPGSYVDVETERVNYATLDRPGQSTRIRLNSTVVRARHIGAAPHQFEPDSRNVEITYMRAGRACKVIAKDVVLACMNNMIPYICPELPNEQKQALHMSVRAVNTAVNVLIRNWQAFANLKVREVACPQSLLTSLALQRPRTFGKLKPSMDPSQPIVVEFENANGGLSNEFFTRQMLGGRLPDPGTSVRDQMRMVRAGLLRTSYETFERAIRRLMGGALARGGFDPARDIVGLTVNRWGHGYALGRNHLFDDESGPGPCELGRKKFGHITIANSDASGIDNAQTAMDEGIRAVRELEPRMYGYYESI
jgi:spermidine dehydrogenase